MGMSNESERYETEEALARMTDAYRGESMRGEFEDDGRPEEDDA